jgi:hypothetical protein
MQGRAVLALAIAAMLLGVATSRAEAGTPAAEAAGARQAEISRM